MSFAWRSTSPRCARSANKSFARLFKGGGVQGQRPCPRSAERGTLFLLHKAQEGVQGGTLAGGSPFSFLALGACAPIRWVVVDGLSCDSTPFLWCLPKETVSSRQRKALFYPGGSTIRVSASASIIFTHLRPTWGGAWWVSGDCTGAPFSWVEVSSPNCPFHPISLLLRKETGWSPKETRLWVPPRELFGPTRLSHGLEAPTSQPTASS